MTEIREITNWFTLPGWTTAHEVEQYGSLGHIRLWITVCGREYRLPDPEVDDRPLQAPAGMRRCGQCVRRGRS
ncbi:MAG: hypothetical protein WBA97_34435 [Actinophytocola sp.]|uniref:hypothetical protein n=1 Tax=Actinophytocola sp. TaxID=1872138 RepID=UPI003C74E64C